MPYESRLSWIVCMMLFAINCHRYQMPSDLLEYLKFLKIQFLINTKKMSSSPRNSPRPKTNYKQTYNAPPKRKPISPQNTYVIPALALGASLVGGLALGAAIGSAPCRDYPYTYPQPYPQPYPYAYPYPQPYPQPYYNYPAYGYPNYGYY